MTKVKAKKKSKKKAKRRQKAANVISDCTFSFSAFEGSENPISDLALAITSNADALASNAQAIEAVAEAMKETIVHQMAINLG